MSDDGAEPEKISEALARRLDVLPPDQLVRLIVLLRLPETEPRRESSRRESRARPAEVDAVRSAAQSGIVEVERLLKSHGGSVLTPDLSTLGAVAVETTVRGARALAESEQVRAIVEDLPVSGAS